METVNVGLKQKFEQSDIDDLKEFIHHLVHTDPAPRYSPSRFNKIEEVEDMVEIIGENEKLSEENILIAKSVIWFVSLPNLTEIPGENQKNELVAIADKYLTEKGFVEEIKKEILTGVENFDNYSMKFSNAIALAQDALTAYFGQKGLKSRITNEFKEFDMLSEDNTDKIKWIEKYVDRIRKHRFHTRYCRSKFRKRKLKNVDKLNHFTYELKSEASLTYNKRAMTMFKTASRNQVDLVNIADKKSGIMITVNSILLTIMLPLFASYIIDMSAYIVPGVILIVTCGVCIILATLATKPISKKDPTKKDFTSGNRSLFYFRNFSTIDKEDYKKAVRELIVRDAPFENAVITDLYDLGVTLSIKYKKLTWCYWVFAIGIGLTLVSLLFTLFYFNYS